MLTKCPEIQPVRQNYVDWPICAGRPENSSPSEEMFNRLRQSFFGTHQADDSDDDDVVPRKGEFACEFRTASQSQDMQSLLILLMPLFLQTAS